MAVPRVKTFLLVERIFWDSRNDSPTFAGVAFSLAINPETGTNDRYEMAIEFEQTIRERMYLEFRMLRLGEPSTTVFRAAYTYDPALSDSMRWMFFTLPSATPGRLVPGSQYRIELWSKDEPLAARDLGCVSIADETRPPQW